MKKLSYLRTGLIAVAFLVSSCASGSFKGSATDRTGTNGTTNGNGKVYTGS
ncbi:MAG TPA: hypothetical protein VF676_08745 [Flavobacterium sp.]|jgi:hypothetical protein